MLDSATTLIIVVFIMTIILMLWRPFGMNETIPTTIGAVIVLLAGIVSFQDVVGIVNIVSGPSLTILSTIMMSIVLESIGFFKWIASNIIVKSRSSGIRLFCYTNLLCFFMTMLFNNDGSILITTPIIIHIVQLLRLKPHQMTPYLLSGVLIATAASAPIAVSNISNLIALEIVHLSLNSYVQMMFIPSMIGIMMMACLLYMYFKKSIPKKIILHHFLPYSLSANYSFTHPLDTKYNNEQPDWMLIKLSLVIVVLTRASFFIFSPYGISIEWIGLIGATILIVMRWLKMKIGIMDILIGSPWHIFLFAFNMYVLIYGMKNVGLYVQLVTVLKPFVSIDAFNATMVMGFVTTVLSNIFNNLPAVMIGTLTIVEMNLDPPLLKIAYLANVLGSDIGALLTPIGTLATLIWMFIIKKHDIKLSWGLYMRVTLLVIPPSLLVSLCSLYIWIIWLFQ